MYTLLKSGHSPRSWSPRNCSRSRLCTIIFGLVAIVTVAIGLDYLVWGTRFQYRTFQFVSLNEHACDNAQSTPITNASGPPTIPNLAHYVWLSENPADFNLSFKFFISIYSAYIHWRPERIYIHTNAAPEAISRARDSGATWTRRILAIPRVEINYVEAPQTTHKGLEIKWMPHKADFVRLEALRKFGGVYLDADAIPLRDITDLRHTGFRNVIGQQLGLAMWANNYLNNGVMMAAPNTNFMTLYYHAAHEFFDGGWDTASIRLLTDLGNRLAAIPGEVLILQPQAFSPMSWQDEDVKRLFAPSMDSTTATSPAREQQEQSLRASAVASGTCSDVLAWMQYREKNQHSGPVLSRNEMDFSSTYVLHAFDNPVERVVGKGFKVDVKYILARQSNYARAVFPVIWQAIQDGIIPKDEMS